VPVSFASDSSATLVPVVQRMPALNESLPELLAAVLGDDSQHIYAPLHLTDLIEPTLVNINVDAFQTPTSMYSFFFFV
jgi:hypothetical protein